MIEISPEIALNDDEISYSFIHASGPGGQNVNKVASAVQLRFNITGSLSLPDAVKDRLVSLGGSRVTDNGEIVITARRFRTQERNKQDALERLVNLIRKASIKPRARRKTKPTARSIERRLQVKQRRKRVKKDRQPVDPFEE
jgi:ribosome-associated protein